MSGSNEAAQLAQILRTTIKNYGLESDQLTMVQVIGILEVIKHELLEMMMQHGGPNQ
jgi:hypothetical protein